MQLKGRPSSLPCQAEGLVYGAKVTKTSDQSEEFHTGLTARPFKLRFYEYQSSFRPSANRHKTTLSNHMEVER